ncbi:MAG: sugar ABC transporter substrate-binding protein [Chloroflexi bacterium]|nr:sugar ABC transporter substrate-binding protein [Chloroflexota bacterium]
MSRKLWSIASLLLIVALVVTACTPAAPTAAPKPTEAPKAAAPTEAPKPTTAGPVTLLWGFWGSPEEKASHQRVAEAFMKQYPNITIEYFFAPWDDYFTKLKTLWAGGDPKAIPDIMFMWPTPSFAARGVLENLEPYIKKDNYNTNDYWPTLLDSARYKGDIYGLPRDIEATVLYYNKKLFDAAGVKYPTDEWTWDDLLAAAEKLTVKDAGGRVSQYALGMEGSKWPLWVGQAGGQMLDDLTNPGKCTLDTPQALKGLQFFYDLMQKGYAIRSATMSQQGGDSGVFQAGQVAMIIQNSSRVADFNAAKDLNYDVAAVPFMKGGTRWNVNGGAAWVMSAKSSHKDEAWLFLKWLQSSGGGQNMYTKNGDIFPALRTVAGSSDFMGLGKPSNRKAFLIGADAMKPGGFAYFPEWDELNDSIISPQMERLWAGEAAPDKVIPDLCKAVNKFLADKGYPKK